MHGFVLLRYCFLKWEKKVHFQMAAHGLLLINCWKIAFFGNTYFADFIKCLIVFF